MIIKNNIIFTEMVSLQISSENLEGIGITGLDTKVNMLGLYCRPGKTEKKCLEKVTRSIR